MSSFASADADDFMPPPPPVDAVPPPPQRGSSDDEDLELMSGAAAVSTAGGGGRPIVPPRPSSLSSNRFSTSSFSSSSHTTENGDDVLPLPPPPDIPLSQQHQRRKSALHVLQSEGAQSFTDLAARMQKSSLGGLGGTNISSPIPPSVAAGGTTPSPVTPTPASPFSTAFDTRPAGASISQSSTFSSVSRSAAGSVLNNNNNNNNNAAAGTSATAPGTPLTPMLQRRGSDFRQRLNSVPLLPSSIFSALSPGTAPSTPGLKKTCTYPNCVAFASRNNYCLRHLWRSTVEQLEPCNESQYQVAKEIVTTEKSYADSLRIIYKSFVLRLKVQFELEPTKALITTEEMSQIFHNIEDIFKLSEQLYGDLEEITLEKVLTSSIGTTLLHYAPLFRIYQSYLENYDEAVRVLNQVRKEKGEFDFFCKLQEKCEGMSLESFLIMPVQRLPRYLLLLNELIKRSQSATGLAPGSLDDMIAARDRISAIATAINLSLHQKENQAKVAQIQNCFERDARYQDLVTPTRYIIREGMLKKRYGKGSRHLSNSTMYAFFLFNDILLYADASKNVIGKGVTYKLKHILPLSDMVVTPTSSAKGKDKDILISSRSGGSDKSFEISCLDTADRNDWLKAIQSAIDTLAEDHKNLKSQCFDGSSGGNERKSQKFKTMMGV